jgi:hypothetical protein
LCYEVAVSNPFSTRNIRPGAQGFIFPSGESAASLVERLRASNWLGQIIGPHGSGKSTLLAALVAALEAAGRTVVRCDIRGQETGDRRQGTVSADSLRRVELGPTTQLVIDGHEQLSWWTRKRTENRCRRHGAGLLVTVHQDLGLPNLFVTQPTLDLAQQVVRRLLGPEDQTVAASDVSHAWDEVHGNLRETLFKLYDVYQGRRG